MQIMSVPEAEKSIDEILGRGVGVFVDPEGTFRKKLIAKATGKFSGEIVVKFGVDPTRPDIHLGHAVILRKLRQLQDLGCKVIFLVGDFTAMIGDPTGKSKVRPQLDQQEVTHNVNTYITQIPKILKIEPITTEEKTTAIIRDPNGFIVDSPWFGWMRNAEWFYGVTDVSTEGATGDALTVQFGESAPVAIPAASFAGKAVLYENTRMQKAYLKRAEIKGVSLVNVLSILRSVSHAQLIERDMFQDRLKNAEPLFMHEMLYPVMQGIDSDVLAEIYGSCDIEVGGTDQTFNMLMGRKVMEMTKKPPQAVLSFALLIGLDGKEKMSKSLDNYVGITDTPPMMFGKLMSIPDQAIPTYFELCTYTPMQEVERITRDLQSGKAHPKEIKMDLAEQIVDIYHGSGAGVSARDYFINTFQKKEIPSETTLIHVPQGTALVDALLAQELVESKTDFRRLLLDGAIRKNGEEKLTDPQTVITEPITLKIGKHRFISFDIEQ